MKRSGLLCLIAVSLLLANARSACGADPSAEAAKGIEEFNKDAAAIRKRADDEILARRGKLIDKLQALQDSYTKEAKLDEALAIRELIRQIKSNSIVPRQADVLSAGVWEPAELLQEKDGKFFVHYKNWADSWNEWVARERIRFKPGSDVSIDKIAVPTKNADVLSGGTWWPAEVLQEKDGKFFIHYTGWADSWNEWVDKDHIRFKTNGDTAAGKKAAAAKKAEALSGSTWWAAEVLQEKDGKYFIHYTGWNDSWNEWVDKDHIRFGQSGEGAPDATAAPAK